ncbi:MAG: glutamine-hydrolyzing GMP synthase [Rickettsiales bacterium]|nr:glutamine-hydrolyzing GMP synthase [Rickettsiales bacterium]OUV79502.1 MAG: GMP synthase (glutamine-hydrolyzing) [Rickettsiales bacterium TMED131]|tara:strand:+ start:117 stop:1682 length:1566 start_codon:yes stop_codon:yes gene_type:complete
MIEKNIKSIPVIVVDFGSQTTQLILRRIRECGVYCEVVSHKNLIEKIELYQPKAIIFSGGPSSVFSKFSPKVDQKVFKKNIPILGICYGMQVICEQLNGKVNKTSKREFGKAYIKALKLNPLFKGMIKKGKKSQVWMSHGDEVISVPKGFDIIATSNDDNITAIANIKKNIYGLQFHPEVIHTLKGKQLIENFIIKISKIKPRWRINTFLKDQIYRINKVVGNNEVICGLSGGVDSSVVAALINKSIGNKLTCIFVNHGLLREGEEKEVLRDFKKYTNAKIVYVNAKNEFLKKLRGISNPEIKRKIIGKEFIRVFEKEAKKIKKAKFLAQGTLYPDVIESKHIEGSKLKVIKSHHNVGGLPKKLNLKLLEPLRELFKDEVRVLGKELKLPKHIIERHPFPGPGLAIRIPGEITSKKINILKKADLIYINALKNNNLYDKIWQAFCVLLPIKSVGVMGDSRSYELTISLRAITSKDGMTAEVYYFEENFLKKLASDIIGQVRGVNRVLYDITSKPPATIEWE